MENELATEKQVNYMKSLGLEIIDGLTIHPDSEWEFEAGKPTATEIMQRRFIEAEGQARAEATRKPM